MNSAEITPKQILFQARVVWSGLIAGLVLAASVFAFLIARGQGGAMAQDKEALSLFFYTEIGLTVLMTLIGLSVRPQIFKRGWVGNVVTPLAYLTGNITAWAMCEGPAFFGIITCFLAGTFWPYGIPPLVSFVLLLLLWPNGRAMFPPRDPYATGER